MISLCGNRAVRYAKLLSLTSIGAALLWRSEGCVGVSVRYEFGVRVCGLCVLCEGVFGVRGTCLG